MACTADTECPGGTCPGKEPAQGGAHAGVCNCTCLGEGLGSNAPVGSMACNLGVAITVERDSNQICGDVVPSITLSPLCGALTTAHAAGQAVDANNSMSGQGQRLPPGPGGRGPLEVDGTVRSCSQVDAKQITGLEFAGYLMFYDSSLGDILAEQEFICQ
jgi:hypothetical protein